MLDDDSVLPAIRAGARGYLLKDAGVDDLVRAITAVHRGETILSKRAAEHVHRRLTQAADARNDRSPSSPIASTTCSRRSSAVATARRSPERSGLSPKTVRNYVSNVLAKLHARDRADLVIKARAAGYPDT